MTGTPTPPIPIITTGLEHYLLPSGTVSEDETTGAWQSVTFDDLPQPIILNGFRVQSRYYVETCITAPGANGEDVETCTRSYPAWNLISQTLVKSSPSRQVFDTDEGTELFTAPPGVYGYSTAGITDGTKYEYYRVFDRADISYIARASTINQPVIKQPKTLPTDEENGYIMDALTSFLPDPRESVTITYTLTTNYGGGTNVFTINHIVLQDIDDIADKIEGYLSKSYFSDGKYHAQLHELEEEDMYDEGGKLIKPEIYKVPEYDENNKLINTVSDVTSEDILKTQGESTSKDLSDLVSMIDNYEYPV